MIWWGKRLVPPSSFILRLSNPFRSPDLISLLGPFPPYCLLPRNWMHIRNRVGCASGAKQRPHRRILAPGLTGRPFPYVATKKRFNAISSTQDNFYDSCFLFHHFMFWNLMWSSFFYLTFLSIVEIFGDDWKLYSVLWSLELASELFHDFFAYDFGGEESWPSDLQAWIVEGGIPEERGCDWEEIQHHERVIPFLATSGKEFGSAL